MRCLECGTEIAGRAQVCARCGSWAPVEYQLYVAEDRAADAACDAAGGRAPAAEAVPVRCLECGAESAEPAQACGRCEAPGGQQRPIPADAAGGSAGLIPPDHRPAGLRTRPGSRRNALVIVGAGLAVLTTVTVVSTLANSPAPSGSSPSTSQPSGDELRAGDCLKGSDLDLGHSTPWPDHVTVVPCAQEHIAEVFFAGNPWPESQAYPGKNAIDSRADDRCNTAFTTYDGTTSDNSAFTYDIVVPDVSDDWASGDRSIACVAYESTSQYPDGAPMDYSIKGSKQ